MGSQFMSLHLVDPKLVQARLRGDFPDLARTVYEGQAPPPKELQPAFELMARGMFCFLKKGETHPDGMMYCRAVEHLFKTLGRRHWQLEFYPDEGQYPLWELAFGRCEATWLDLPHSNSGIAVTAWKSPETCRSFAYSIERSLKAESFNPRLSPETTLREAVEALREGSDFGLFAIFQG
ncbi:MAG: hypothetical protein IPK82_44340 [Polyangiaceae bacterium]|nr:hypothetical protein [Polyangiaceae bacterium]